MENSSPREESKIPHLVEEEKKQGHGPYPDIFEVDIIPQPEPKGHISAVEKLIAKTENQDGIKTCKALNMKNLPHIGIYSFNYEWMSIISYYRNAEGNNWDQIVPLAGRKAVGKLINDIKLRTNKLEYLTVNYSAQMFRNKFFNLYKQKYVRFNLVFHPYFMDYVEPGLNEEKKWIMASIYTKDDFLYGLKVSNSGPIPINEENLILPQNWMELHIHRADEDDPNTL